MRTALNRSRSDGRRSLDALLRNVAVVGAGYVGLVTAAVISRWGYRVRCFDKDVSRIATLASGGCPIFEPGLMDLLREQRAAGMLSFASRIDVSDADVVFICVGTPSQADGSVQLDDLYRAVAEIGETLRPGALAVAKSTVPVGTCEQIEKILSGTGAGPFHVLSNPEFLRQGSAIADSERPDRVVIGARSSEAAQVLAGMFAGTGAPVYLCDLRSAELTKYAANAFLATKLSFINEIAHIAEQVGADGTFVSDAIGSDPRIGRQFLNAGLGYGGSCLPKDLAALRKLSQSKAHHSALLDAVIDVNVQQKHRFVSRIEDALGGFHEKTVAVLGISFKPNTGDVRNSVAIELIEQMEAAGARIRAYDPVAMPAARGALKNGTYLASDAYDACAGAEAMALVTEWPEFARLEWSRVREVMREPRIFDGRNLFDPSELRSFGFQYYGVGRNGHSQHQADGS